MAQKPRAAASLIVGIGRNGASPSGEDGHITIAPEWMQVRELLVSKVNRKVKEPAEYGQR